MKKAVHVVGVDPGLAHTGLVVARLKPGGFEVVWENDKPLLWCLETEKSNKKLAVRASDDNTRRAREMFKPLYQAMSYLEPKVIVAEAMSFPRNSSASHKLGISWGIIVTMSCFFELPIVQVSPQQIKKAVCGKRDASKEEIQNALSAKHKIPLELFTKDRREHPFDAIGALEASMDSEVIRVARSMAA